MGKGFIRRTDGYGEMFGNKFQSIGSFAGCLTTLHEYTEWGGVESDLRQTGFQADPSIQLQVLSKNTKTSGRIAEIELYTSLTQSRSISSKLICDTLELYLFL